MTFPFDRKTFLLFIISAFSLSSAWSQDRLSVFVDCANTWCDRQYFRMEMPIVNYSRDRIESDVHVLITDQRVGSGGREYQIIFFGQRNYGGLNDTLSFNTKPLATDNERREAILNNMKIGLVPFLIKNGQTDIINIKFDPSDPEEASSPETLIDPWDFWVFRIGGNGSINLDQNYERLRLGGNWRAFRVTEDKKIWFSGWGNQNNQIFKYEEDSTTDITRVQNHNLNFRHFMVWSINKKWASGYSVGYSNSTFDNFKRQYFFSPSVEYNFFPYSDVNNKLLTLRYGVAALRNEYFETTIYEKDKETRAAQYISLAAEFNQKFGTIEIGSKYQHYFHDLDINNLSVDMEVEIRLTGNLSFEVYLYGALVHDQIFLPKGDATQEEVLARVRQFESNFEFNTWFGINYRFGSNLNNFVNPRFGSRGF